MGGTRYRVFRNPGRRGEKARNEIEPGRGGAGGNNDTPDRQRRQSDEVRLQSADGLLALDFHQIVEVVSTYPMQSGSQGGVQVGRNRAWLGHLGREIEFNPLLLAPGGEQAAFGMETGEFAGR